VQVFQSDLSRVNVCSQVFLPFRSYVNLMMVLTLSMWLTHYDHQLNAVHDFNLLLKHNGIIIDLLYIYLEHKIKRILAFWLNWKVNFNCLTQKWVIMEACIYNCV